MGEISLKPASQNEKILSYLKTHDHITSMQAMYYFGCTRLAARIKDLERMGYRFKKETIVSHNRYGDVTRFTGYKLDEESAE